MGYLITEQYKQHSCFEGVIVFSLLENESGNEQVAPVSTGSCAPLFVYAVAVIEPDSVAR